MIRFQAKRIMVGATRLLLTLVAIIASYTESDGRPWGPLHGLSIVAIAALLIWGKFFMAAVAALMVLSLQGFIDGLLQAAVILTPILLFYMSWFVAAGVSALLLSIVQDGAQAPMSLALVSLFAFLYPRVTARIPSQWEPLPRPPKTEAPFWIRVACKRCDRKIRQGDMLGAEKALATAKDPHSAYRFALIKLEQGDFQPALSITQDVAALPRVLRDFALLLRGRALAGTAQFEPASQIYLDASRIKFDDRTQQLLKLLTAENNVAAGNVATGYAEACSLLESESRPDFIMRQRAHRIIVEYHAEGGDFDAAKKAVECSLADLYSNRGIARLALNPDPAELVRNMFGARSRAYVHSLRPAILDRRITILRDNFEDDDGSWDADAFGLSLFLGGAIDDLIDLMLIETRHAAAMDQTCGALTYATRALMELDRTRYLLAAQSTRSSWSHRFQTVLLVALDLAHREEDHRFMVELLEFARVQTLPAVTGQQQYDLVLSTPPVVMVNGTARLGRPGAGRRPPCIAIEDAAVRAAGEGAWWLSFWMAGDWLYWSCLSPAGESQSGRTAFDAKSEAARLLAELEKALPVLAEGETAADADVRLDSSALLINPRAEEAMSTQLGRILLPSMLRSAALSAQQSGLRLKLAIASVAQLGHVPWSLIVVSTDARGHTRRLIEIADWVLAPSAALLCAAEPRQGVKAPLALAVVDTTDEPTLGELPGARGQADSLPANVRILGGAHWTRDVATVASLEKAFKSVGPDVSVAFICHAVRGTPDRPSAGGVVLSPDRGLQLGVPSEGGGNASSSSSSRNLALLTPQDLLSIYHRGVRFPCQVLLQACDTSGLTDAASGEWLTIGPAFLAGGTREVVTTVYPLLDTPDSDDPVMLAAVQGSSLRVAVADMQRSRLLRWKRGEVTVDAHAPIVWGAYAVLSVHPRLSDAIAFRAPPSEELIRFLSDAIKECRESRNARLDSGFLLSAILERGLADLLDGGGNGWSFTWELGPYILSRHFGIRDPGPTIALSLENEVVTVPEIVVRTLREAEAEASREGVPLSGYHVVTNLLENKDCAATRILRLLSRIRHQHAELIQRALLYEYTRAVASGVRVWSDTDSGPNQNTRMAAALVRLALE